MLRESGAPVSGIFHGFNRLAIKQSALNLRQESSVPE